MDWSNPAAYLVALGTVSILVSIGIWIGRMEYFRGTVEKTLVEIRADIGKIFDLLSRASVVSSESPIKLTDLGRTISGELDADKWAEERVARLKDELQGKSPYEIQEYCFEFAKGNTEYDPILVTNMQASAYNHGLELDQVKRVFGVALRDALMKSLGLEPTATQHINSR